MENKIATISSIFVIFLAAFLLADEDIENPTECPKDLEATEKANCCSKLNESRLALGLEYKDCCQYPQLVIFRWDYEPCLSKCNASEDIDNPCCILECALQKIKVLDEEKFNGINPEGLKYSLLLSVLNNTMWIDQVNDSVNTCNLMFNHNVPSTENEIAPNTTLYDDFWYCPETIPKYFLTMLDCIYATNYLKCPTFNENIEGCNVTKQFVLDCVQYLQ